MQDFIVLGLVPGTNIQLTFAVWESGMLFLLGLVVLWPLWRRRFALRSALAMLEIALVLTLRRLPA